MADIIVLRVALEAAPDPLQRRAVNPGALGGLGDIATVHFDEAIVVVRFDLFEGRDLLEMALRDRQTVVDSVK